MLQLRLMQAKTSACVIALLLRVKTSNGNMMLWSNLCCPYLHHCNQCTPRSKCDAWIWPLLPAFASLQSMHTPIKVWCLDLTIAARIRITAINAHPDQSVMLGSDHCCPYSHHYNQCTPQLKCDAWIWPLLPVFASLQQRQDPKDQKDFTNKMAPPAEFVYKWVPPLIKQYPPWERARGYKWDRRRWD